MTFDPYANQGDTSAWDPEETAATKRAADKIFSGDPADTEESDNPSGEGEGTTVKQDPHAPDEVPDPDLVQEP